MKDKINKKKMFGKNFNEMNAEEKKKRFDFLKKSTKGFSKSFSLGSPYSGKNRAQRARLNSAFGIVKGSPSRPIHPNGYSSIF